MTVDQIEALIRKYLQTGLAVVVILAGPATAAPGANAQPQVITVPPGASPARATTSAAPAASVTGTTADTAATDTGGETAAAAPADTATIEPTPPTTHKDKKKDKKSTATSTHTTAPDHAGSPAAAQDDTAASAAADNTAAGAAQDGTAAPDQAGSSPSTDAQTATPTPNPTPNSTQPQAPPSADGGTTAADRYGWGTPDRTDDFSGDLSGWGLYDGPGHAGNGKRSPAAASVANGILTITGDANGTTEGMAWNNGRGQKYGRWEGRVRAPASDPSYNALLLLWPDAENFPEGGELDFMEMTDHTRQSTNLFLHYGKDNAQVHGEVAADATQWHNWAVEWTPKGVTTFVDGRPWWHTEDAAILPPGPMHLCIQLDWFPKDGSGTVKPSQMQVDWVRQYPVDGSGPSHATTATATASTTVAGSGDPKGSVMRDVIRGMFGW